MRTLKKLFSPFLIFCIILLTKIILNFGISHPFIFSDESCVVQIAQSFAKTLHLYDCQEIITVPGGTPFPFYSILISPIYYLFDGPIAYRLSLILNIILSTSMLFPIYYFISKFTNNKYLRLIIPTLVILAPQISVYENTLMTESIYITLSIWTIYFYAKSFESGTPRKHKIISLILSLLATLSRPFGIILPIALFTNEIYLEKNKKRTALIYLPILFITILSFWKNMPENLKYSLVEKFRSLGSINTSIFALDSILSQMNSYLIAGLFIFPIAGILFLITSKTQIIKNIKVFIITLIGLNTIISTQHFLGYLLNKGRDPGLLTRYINISIILLIIFGFAFLVSKPKNITKSGKILFLISSIPLATLSHRVIKHTLNLDLSSYYSMFRTTTSMTPNSISINPYAEMTLIILFIILTILFINNRKKTILTVIGIFLVTNFFASHYWISTFSSLTTSNITKALQYKEDKIIYLGVSPTVFPKNYSYWQLLSTSKNNIEYNSLKSEGNSLEVPNEIRDYFVDDYDYIVTQYHLNLPILQTVEAKISGVQSKEYLYKTKKGETK